MSRNNIIAVFVGGEETPEYSRFHPVLKADPEIPPTALVITFEGLSSDECQDDRAVAAGIICQAAPGFMDDRFTFHCERIEELFVIKVYAEQYRKKPSEYTLPKTGSQTGYSPN